MSSTPQHVTQLLNDASEGDSQAAAALLPLVYEELRRLAQQRLANEPSGQTLQPTALVHEAYLRLLGEKEVRWDNRGHFFAAAAKAMRRIMIERARRVASIKHGGRFQRLPLDDAVVSGACIVDNAAQLLDLEAALSRLEKDDPRKAQIVMLRFYAGLSIEQTAAVMSLSPATVKNEWRFARAWLHGEMSESRGRGHPNDGG